MKRLDCITFFSIPFTSDLSVNLCRMLFTDWQRGWRDDWWFWSWTQGLLRDLSEVLPQFSPEWRKTWVFAPSASAVCCGFLLMSLHRVSAKKEQRRSEVCFEGKTELLYLLKDASLLIDEFLSSRLIEGHCLLAWREGGAFICWAESLSCFVAIRSSLIKNHFPGLLWSHCFRLARGKASLGFCHVGDQIKKIFAWFCSSVAIIVNVCGPVFKFLKMKAGTKLALLSSCAEVT